MLIYLLNLDWDWLALDGRNLKFKFHVIFQDFEFIEIIKIC